MSLHFEVRNTGRFGTPGEIILEGFVVVDEDNKSVCIERTGPYVPDYATGSGILIVAPTAIQALKDKWGEWIHIVIAKITKAVTFDIEYEQLEDIFDRYRGEPEDIILSNDNDDNLREAIGVLYAVFPKHEFFVETIDHSLLMRREKKIILHGVAYESVKEWPVWRRKRYDSYDAVCCSQEFVEWLVQQQGDQKTLDFIEMQFSN